MRSIRGRLIVLIGLLCLLTVGLPPLCRAADGPIAGGSPSGGSLSAEGLRNLLEDLEIIDVDPAEAGTTTAGLQEALSRCSGSPAGNCILQLRANTTYTFAARNLWDSEHGFETNGGDNIWIRGYGDSSVISFQNTHPGETPGATLFDEMMTVEPGSTNVRFSDFKAIHDDTCVTGCTLGYGMVINVMGSAQDVTVEHINVVSTQAATTDSTAPNAFGVRIEPYPDETPANVPQRVHISHNRFQMGNSAAIHSLICNNCEYSDNDIRFVLAEDTSPTGTVRGMTIFGGTGYVIANNVIDLSMNGLVNAGRYSSCLILQQDQTVHGAPETAQARINSGAVISGNHCKGIRSANFTGIMIQGYNAATISGNTIEGGVCSNDSTQGCANWQDCGSGNTCNASPGKCMWFDGTVLSTSGADGNNYNTIAGNTCRNFQESGGACGINIATHANSPASGGRNSFIANTFEMADPNTDGFCGTSSLISTNHYAGNFVSGVRSDATRCLGGMLTSYACALPIVSDGTNANQGFIKPGKFGLESNTYFPSTPATGELVVITDDAYPGACASAGGSARSICRYSGSAWGPLNGYTVASGTAALGTSLIGSGACATVVTVAATGVLTTDAIEWTPNADISGVTGYAPVTTGALSIYPYPTANNANFKVCNPTASGITPGAVTLNWRVPR